MGPALKVQSSHQTTGGDKKNQLFGFFELIKKLSCSNSLLLVRNVIVFLLGNWMLVYILLQTVH